MSIVKKRWETKMFVAYRLNYRSHDWTVGYHKRFKSWHIRREIDGTFKFGPLFFYKWS